MKKQKLCILARAGKSKEPFSIVASEDKGQARVEIIGYIHEWSQASSNDLREQIRPLVEAGHKDALIYLNTKGGQTFEASEIFNVIRQSFPGKLIAVSGAINASAGTYISSKADEYHVHGNSQFMWHKPMGVFEGSYDEIVNNLKLLKDAETDYLATYVKKTGKTESELKGQWDKGDQWLLGKEIVEAGFADKVLDDEAPISQADVDTLEAIGAPTVPVATAQPRSKQENQDTMKFDVTKLGLSANATESEINAKIDELNANAAKAEKLEKEQEEKAEKERKDEIKSLLDDATKENKITAKTRPHYENVLNKDFESGKAILEGLSSVPDITDHLDTGDGEGAEGREKWTFSDWQQKDPKGLAKMHEKEPKKFDKLFEAENKKSA
jgi:ATP-dependent protease ClpP protease subunit